MNHEQVLERSSQFLDGELPASEQAEMFRHLSECEECRTAFGRMMSIGHAAHRMTAVTVPPALDQRFVTLAPVSGTARLLERRVSVPAMILSLIAVMMLSVSVLVTAAGRGTDNPVAEQPSMQTVPSFFGNPTSR